MNRHTYIFFRKRVHSSNQIQKQLRITILKSQLPGDWESVTNSLQITGIHWNKSDWGYYCSHPKHKQHHSALILP